MKATEKSNTKEKEETLFFDEDTYAQSIQTMKQQVSEAEYCAKEWSQQARKKMVPVLTKKLFLQWLQEFDLLEKLYAEETARLEYEKYGPAREDLTQPMFQIHITDRPRLERGLLLLSGQISTLRYCFASNEWIDFDASGKPFLSDETKQAIREKCTFKKTKENEKLLSDLKTFCGTYNDLLAFLEMKTGRKIRLSDFKGVRIEDGHASPDTVSLLQELFYKQEPGYVDEHAQYINAPKAETPKAVKIPADWK